MKDILTFKDCQEITEQTTVKKVESALTSMGIKYTTDGKVVVSSKMAVNKALQLLESNDDDYTV